MKYQFMAEHRHEYPITTMCRVLEVSVSGYYAWSKRPPSQHSREDAQLVQPRKARFPGHSLRVWQSTGSCRVACDIRIHCAQKRVARLMRAQDLFARRPRHRTVTTKSEPEAQVAPNLLQRDFSADQPNIKWVADTTYIWTTEGWLYLAVVLDLFSRMVVGWSMAAIQDATLVVQALRMALARRRPSFRITPSLRPWKYVYERELSRTFRARRHASEYEPYC